MEFVTTNLQEMVKGVLQGEIKRNPNLKQHEGKLECYNFRMQNLIFMVTTKKMVIEYTQLEIRELRYFTVKQKNNETRENDSAGNGQKCYKNCN